MSGAIGFILTATVAIAALAISAGVVTRDAIVTARAAARQAPALPEELLQKNCQACHDLRRVHTSAMNSAEWTATIRRMIDDNDAKVPEEDIPALVRYLAQHHGPIPDGPGREILLNTCTMCHDLGRIKTGRRSAEEWEETLISMLNEGAPLSDAEFPVIHHYLSEHFNAD